MSKSLSEGRLRHVLVVEDSAIIAMDLEVSLLEIGVGRVTPVASVARAMEVLDAGDVDAAFVDVMLGREDGRIVADRLLALGIPFALMTGLDHWEALPERYPGVGLLPKPFSTRDLILAVEKLC